jgi:hypothetical protein
MDSKLFKDKVKKIAKVVDKKLTENQDHCFFAVNDNNLTDRSDIEMFYNISTKALVTRLEDLIVLLKSQPDYEKSPYCLCCGSMETHK